MSDLEELRNEVRALRAHVEAIEQAKLQRWRLFRRLAAVTSALLVSLGGIAWAANGNCPNGLPFCFAPNTAAKAAEVNQNFAQLKEWIEQKVGPTTSADVTTAGATTTAKLTVNGLTTVTGDLDANQATVRGQLSVSGDLVVPDNVTTTAQTIQVGWAGNTWQDANCPSGQFVCGFGTFLTAGEFWQSYFRVRCCKL